MFVAQQGLAAPGHDPLARHRLFHTLDVDEARERVAAVFCPHALAIAGTRDGRVDAAMSHAPLGGVSLNRLRYGATVRIDAGCLDRFLLVMMPLAGTAEVCCGDEHIVSTPELASVVTPTEPLRETVHADCDQVMVRIERTLLERTCSAHLGHDLRAPLRFRLGLDMRAAATRNWLALVNYLLTDLDTDAPALQSPLLRAQAEHLVVTNLLLSQPHNYSEALRQPARAPAPGHVKRVEDYIAAHAAEPLTIADLARVAGTSSSALHAAFRDFRGTTPMQRLKQLRLERVHNELRAARPGATSVTAVATRWGFCHMGHFTANYTRRFGEAPSATLRRTIP